MKLVIVIGIIYRISDREFLFMILINTEDFQNKEKRNLDTQFIVRLEILFRGKYDFLYS